MLAIRRERCAPSTSYNSHPLLPRQSSRWLESGGSSRRMSAEADERRDNAIRTNGSADVRQTMMGAMKRRVLWAVMALLALSVGAYAIAASVLPSMRTELVRALFARDALGAAGQLCGGAGAIGAGAFQVSAWL